MKNITDQAKAAYDSRQHIQDLDSTNKAELLMSIASILVEKYEYIVDANKKDISSGKLNGLSDALIDRLTLNKERIESISKSILIIAKSEDPIGETLDSWERPNGLVIKKVRVPLGCIGMIYEARPNVTADAIAIAIKTSNAIVLRGSASAYNTNLAITTLCKNIVSGYCKSSEFIQLLEDISRDSVKHFVTLKSYLNLVIPRGGASLIQHVVNSATVPTIETGEGNCHVYIDKYCNIDKALSIADNSKTHRPSVCNACETILVHKDISKTFLPKLNSIFKEKNVSIKGCPNTQAIIPTVELATPNDWETEFLSLTVAIKIVDSIDDAINHISRYGSSHTEAIVSDAQDSLDLFQKQVDSSTIILNASTRFTDGGEFGFGAEIGISTQKLHARGPMGISELTSYKYIVAGSGQIRS